VGGFAEVPAETAGNSEEDKAEREARKARDAHERHLAKVQAVPAGGKLTNAQR
jgi:hypothetical protein